MADWQDSDFAYSIQLMIARTLSAKLSAARLDQKARYNRDMTEIYDRDMTEVWP